MSEGTIDPLAGLISRPEKTGGITRGVCRYLRSAGYTVLREFKLNSGRRADVAGLDRNGRFVIVEVKSSQEDFRADGKWPDYIAHCDEFYFAVSETFPVEILPEERGLIIADGFGAQILRPCVPHRMNGNRRRVQVLNFARSSAERLERFMDSESFRY